MTDRECISMARRTVATTARRYRRHAAADLAAAGQTWDSGESAHFILSAREWRDQARESCACAPSKDARVAR